MPSEIEKVAEKSLGFHIRSTQHKPGNTMPRGGFAIGKTEISPLQIPELHDGTLFQGDDHRTVIGGKGPLFFIPFSIGSHVGDTGGKTNIGGGADDGKIHGPVQKAPLHLLVIPGNHHPHIPSRFPGHELPQNPKSRIYPSGIVGGIGCKGIGGVRNSRGDRTKRENSEET